jgi:GNAT superfamily N-acetyltransferase
MSRDHEPLAPVTSAEVAFGEAAPADAAEVATAMGLADPDAARARFTAGSRCFTARVAGEIACYGWVSWGSESIGELECELRLRPDEAYIWDCATLEPFRQRGVYGALLRRIAATLRAEGVNRLWIGASTSNEPSLRAFASAGFQPAVRLTFVRLLTVSQLWVIGVIGAPAALVADARAALVAPHRAAGSGAAVRHI